MNSKERLKFGFILNLVGKGLKIKSPMRIDHFESWDRNNDDSVLDGTKF